MVPEYDATRFPPVDIDGDTLAAVVTVSVAAIAFLYGVLVVEHVLAAKLYALLAVGTYLLRERLRAVERPRDSTGL